MYSLSVLYFYKYYEPIIFSYYENQLSRDLKKILEIRKELKHGISESKVILCTKEFLKDLTNHIKK